MNRQGGAAYPDSLESVPSSRQVIAVVDRKSGLLKRLTRVLMRGNSVLERDTAVYRYRTTP